MWDSRDSAGLGPAKTHSCSAFDPWRGQKLFRSFKFLFGLDFYFYNVYFTKKILYWNFEFEELHKKKINIY